MKIQTRTKMMDRWTWRMSIILLKVTQLKLSSEAFFEIPQILFLQETCRMASCKLHLKDFKKF